jgi:hypothetical protein
MTSRALKITSKMPKYKNEIKENTTQNTLVVYSINCHKSYSSNLELINLLPQNAITCVQEPHLSLGKISKFGADLRILHGTGDRIRACLVYHKDLKAMLIPELSTPDTATAIFRLKSITLVVASVYMDRQVDLPIPLLEKIAEYARQNKFGLLIGADTNCHYPVGVQ